MTQARTVQPLPVALIVVAAVAGWLLSPWLGGEKLLAVSLPKMKPVSTTGLDLVPADAPGFVSIRVADLWQSKTGKALRDRLARAKPDLLKAISAKTGMEISQIERVTIVLPANLTEEPVCIITTSKPYSRDRVLKAVLPKAEEKKKDGKSVYVEPGNERKALHFFSDRLLIVGSEDRLRDFLTHKPQGKLQGSLAEALRLTLKKPLVVAINIGGKYAGVIKAIPGVPDGVTSVLSAKSARLTLVGDKDTRVDFRFTYADRETARKAEQSARELIKQGLTSYDQFKQAIPLLAQGQNMDEMSKWLLERGLALLQEGVEGVRKTAFRQKDTGLEVTITIKASAADMLIPLAGAAFVGMSVGQAQAVQPLPIKR